MMTRRLTLISPSRGLVRSVMQLSGIRRPGEQSDSVGYFSVAPRALLVDGSSLVTPIPAAGRVASWPGAVAGRIQFVHVTRDGTFLVVFATQPENTCAVGYPVPGGGGTAPIPYCAEPLDDLAHSGSRYGYAVVEGQTPARTSYRVTVVRGTGDTAFSRRLERRSVAIPRRFGDSVLAARMARARSPQEEAAYRTMKVPSFYPPLSRVLVGRDDTIWLEEFTPIHQRRSRGWLVLDGAGTPIGRVTLPLSVHIVVANRSTIWATDTDDDGLQHIVRYRVSR